MVAFVGEGGRGKRERDNMLRSPFADDADEPTCRFIRAKLFVFHSLAMNFTTHML